MYATNRTLRLAALVVVALAAGGCFKPKVKNRSFVCDATTPACPTGFACIQGFCDDGSGGPTPGGGNDLSTPPGTGGNGGDDMTMPRDMSMSMSTDMSMPPDLSMPPPDLAKKQDLAQACKKEFDPCNIDADCCNNYCYVDGTCF